MARAVRLVLDWVPAAATRPGGAPARVVAVALLACLVVGSTTAGDPGPDALGADGSAFRVGGTLVTEQQLANG